MTVALCNPDAFYPFRSLVEGPLNPSELPKIQRFVRSVILHDEMKMIMEPWPYMGDEEEFRPEEMAAGGRNVIVAIGPSIDKYEQYNLLHYLQYESTSEAPREIELSDEFLQMARDGARRNSGPHFESHVRFIATILLTIKKGGSIVTETSLANAVTDCAS